MKKFYDKPATPCERLLAHTAIADATKENLRMERGRLDPLGLLHRIREGQAALAALLGSGDLRSGPERESLEQFLAKLPELWREGEARPTHRKAESQPRSWRTRQDPFESVWPEILLWLQENPDATGKSLLERLHREYPGRFPNGQLRTLQRRIKLSAPGHGAWSGLRMHGRKGGRREADAYRCQRGGLKQQQILATRTCPSHVAIRNCRIQIRAPSMRSPVSSANQFFLFLLSERARCTVGSLARSFASSFRFHLVGGTSLVAASNWRLHWRDAGTLYDHRRLPSIRVRPLWPKHLSLLFAHWRSAEAWYRDDPSLLRYFMHTRSYAVRSPGPQSSTRRNRRSTRILLHLLGSALHSRVYTGLAWRSGVRLCRGATGRGISRPTVCREVLVLQRSNQASGAFFVPSRSPEFMP